MKNKAICALFLLSTLISTATPPIIVEKLPYWGAEYFAVVNTHSFDITKRGDSELLNVHIPEANMESFVPQRQLYLGCEVYASRSADVEIQYPNLYYYYAGLELGDIITVIDGESTIDMSYERFYQLLSDGASIAYLRKEEGELKQHQTDIILCNHPDYLTQRGVYDVVAQSGEKNGLVSHIDSSSEKSDIEKYKDWGLTILKDDEYDWFKATTYDFIVVGNDPLTDKELLSFYEERFLKDMRRDTDNPDILISIAKNSNERVSSTYVPRTETIVNTGSTSKPKYNYSGSFNRYETVNHFTTHTQGGYTETTTNTDLFLELVILDAKALRNNPSVPPIIYQATYSQHLTNRSTAILDIYKNVITYLTDLNPYYASDSYQITYRGFEVNDKNVITYINPISMAYYQGLREGDEIQKIDVLISQFHYDFDSGKISYYGKDYIMSKKDDQWNNKSKTSLSEFLRLKDYYLDYSFDFKLHFYSYQYPDLKVNPKDIPFGSVRYKITLKRDGKKQTFTIPNPVDKIIYTNFHMIAK